MYSRTEHDRPCQDVLLLLQVRPLVMERLADRVSLTTALPGLLEVRSALLSPKEMKEQHNKILESNPGRAD